MEMFPRYDTRDMDQVKITPFGTSLAVVIPAPILRSLGWVRGDRLSVWVKGGDIVYRNDSQRAARFTKEWRAQREHHISAEAR